MKGVIVREHGGLEKLLLEDLPDPRPGENDVLIEVRACGVNHLDIWLRRGVVGHRYPLPMIPGSDIAGVVKEVGSAVRSAKPGDEVMVAPGLSCGECARCAAEEEHLCRHYGIIGETRDGGYAELAVVPARNLIARPLGISWQEAAAFPLATLTSWHMLVGQAAVRPGDDVLVHAAGSGVGTQAIQIAKLFDARVIATASDPDKLGKARDIGADDVIDYAREDFSSRVRELTGKRGVDIIIDSVGKDTWQGNLACLAKGGRFVFCGATSGPEVEMDVRRVFFKHLAILGSTMGSQAELREAVTHLAAGRLLPIVADVLPIAEAFEAHRSLEARELFGKIVLEPVSPSQRDLKNDWDRWNRGNGARTG